MFEVQFKNKATGTWGVQEAGFATEVKAIAAMNKFQKKAKFAVLQVAKTVEQQVAFPVGSKVKVTTTNLRNDGLTEKQVVIAVITSNNRQTACYEVLSYEVQENVVMQLFKGGFDIATAYNVVAV